MVGGPQKRGDAGSPSGATAGRGVGPGPELRTETPPITSNHTDMLGAGPEAPAKGRPGGMLLCGRCCPSQVLLQDKTEVAAGTWPRREEQDPQLPVRRPVRAERAPQRLPGQHPHLGLVPGRPRSGVRGDPRGPPRTSPGPQHPCAGGASASLALRKPRGGQSPRRALSRDRRQPLPPRPLAGGRAHPGPAAEVAGGACVAAAPRAPRAVCGRSGRPRAGSRRPPPERLARSPRPPCPRGGTASRPVLGARRSRENGRAALGPGLRRPHRPPPRPGRAARPEPRTRGQRGLHLRPLPPGASPPGSTTLRTRTAPPAWRCGPSRAPRTLGLLRLAES